MDELEELLVGTFAANHLALSSLRCIATADLKGDEPGIKELADKYNVPLQVYTAEELNSVFESGNPPNPPLPKGGDNWVVAVGSQLSPTPRQRVHDLLGMWGVSEPAALLAASSRELLVPRVKTHRATMAVARLVVGDRRTPSPEAPT